MSVEGGLQTIGSAQVLDLEGLTELKELAWELRQTQDTVQRFRTRTEMLVSVLNHVKHPTPDSKYWQAVREQNVHFEQLVLLSFEFRKNAVEIKKLERKLLAEDDELERELLGIELDKCKFSADCMERTAKDRLREIKEWSMIKAELKPHLAYGDQDVNEHQLEAMRKRFAFEAQRVTPYTPPADARNILGLEMTANRVQPEDVSKGVPNAVLPN